MKTTAIALTLTLLTAPVFAEEVPFNNADFDLAMATAACAKHLDWGSAFHGQSRKWLPGYERCSEIMAAAKKRWPESGSPEEERRDREAVSKIVGGRQ